MGTGKHKHLLHPMSGRAMCGATLKTTQTADDWEHVTCANCLRHNPDHQAALQWTDSKADRRWIADRLDHERIISPLDRTIFYNYVNAHRGKTKLTRFDVTVMIADFKKIPLTELAKQYGPRRIGE